MLVSILAYLATEFVKGLKFRLLDASEITFPGLPFGAGATEASGDNDRCHKLQVLYNTFALKICERPRRK